MKLPKGAAVAALVLLMGATARSAPRTIYPDPGQARVEIATALKSAAQTHKRVLLVFGGNWCGDCIVLDMYFHNERNRPLLEGNFLVVHVNVGQYDANLDLAKQYGIPLEKGVPAVAVLSDTGKLLYSQKSGEFESMRRMDSGTVTQFLVQWKPAKAGCSVVAVNC